MYKDILKISKLILRKGDCIIAFVKAEKRNIYLM